MADEVDPEVDALFDLPADEFVAARDALARARRAAGDREAAAAVKQLRRPTLSAWALNQLARRHPDDVRTLAEQGAALAAAQEQALSGGEVDLREAGRARNETLRRLNRAADAVLGAQGSTAHRDEVAATLTAASSDPCSGDLLLAGRLSEPLEAPSGFGGPFSAGSSPAATAAGSEPARRSSPSARRPAAARSAPGPKTPRAGSQVGRAVVAAEARQKAPGRRVTKAAGTAVAVEVGGAGAGEEAARRPTEAAEGRADEARAAAAAASATAEAAAERVAALEDQLAQARAVLADAEQEAGRRRRAAAAAEAALVTAREAVATDGGRPRRGPDR